MARLNLIVESDDELPDVPELLANSTWKKEKLIGAQTKKAGKAKQLPTTALLNPELRRQRPLKISHVNSLLLPVANKVRQDERLPPDASSQSKSCEPPRKRSPFETQSESKIKKGPDAIGERSSPLKAARVPPVHSPIRPQPNSGLPMEEDNSPDESISDFIVSQSESDLEALPLRSPRRKKKEGFARESASQNMAMASDHSVIDLLSPPTNTRQSKRSETPPPGPSHETFNEDYLGQLRFSPPRSRTPHRRRETEKSLTPPCSPSKPDLQSPSKRSHRIPPSPHRPSIDAFWSQEIINDWNDQHSPRKPKSPRKLFSVHEDDDEAYLSPSASPRRSPTKTPGRRDKAAIERKKAFDERKVQLAVDFLKELDLKVADGRVGVLAESAGGIKVIWSKKLHSTAGRANWKRETLVSRNSTAGAGTKIYRHHASIELAEKVIDDEERLINVLAHEYCHLANFMISGIKTNPHGKEFKEWAAKTTHLFSHRNINVTTKHTYAISYKYIWTCTSAFCGLEYKRHSRSIDPAKHTCGACKSKLVQIQPAPRKGKSRDGEATLSAYQIYIRSNSARVRRENPGLGIGEVMKKLGEEFRDVKARKLEEKESLKEPIVEIAALNDELKLDGDQDDSADDVFKKLDLLRLD